MLFEVGATIIALAAFATAIGVLCRLRPVKWLWRTVISQPIMGAFHREVAEVIEPVAAKVDHLEITVDHMSGKMNEIEVKVNGIELELHSEDDSTLRDAVDKVVEQVVDNKGGA